MIVPEVLPMFNASVCRTWPLCPWRVTGTNCAPHVADANYIGFSLSELDGPVIRLHSQKLTPCPESFMATKPMTLLESASLAVELRMHIGALAGIRQRRP